MFSPRRLRRSLSSRSNVEDGDHCDDDEDVDSWMMIALKMMMTKEKEDEKRKDKKLTIAP